MAAQGIDVYDQIWALMLNPDKTNFQIAIEDNPFLIQVKNHFKMTLLHFAARNGDWPAIKILINNGADLAHRGGAQNVQTALHFAAMKGRPFVIALTVWTLRVHQKDHISLLEEVFPTINKMKLFSQINDLQGKNFTSLLIQIIQQMAPEKSQQIALWKNTASKNQFLNALIILSEQIGMEAAMTPLARPLIHPDSPIFSHSSVSATPSGDPHTSLSNGCKL